MKLLAEDGSIVLVTMMITMAATVNAFLVPWLEPLSTSFSSQVGRQCQQQTQTRITATTLFASETVSDEEPGEQSIIAALAEGKNYEPVLDRFDLETALFCSGLAFDAYTEPPANSSRWERGVSGRNIGFYS